MNPNTNFFLISLSLSSICCLNVNGLNDFRQHRALNGSRNRREYERDFERCLERCEDRRDRDEEDEDNRNDRREIERNFDTCEERCEEDLIRDERRGAELEADEYLSIRYPNIEGSLTMEYADLDDEDDNELEIKYRIENGPTSCNDCKLAIVDECKLANVDGDTLLELDGDGYLLDTEVEFDNEREARDSLDFELRRGDLENFECMYVVLFEAQLQNRKLRGADTGKTSDRKLRNRNNELERISGEEVENLGEPVACGQLVPRRSSRSDRSNRSRCRHR